MNEKAPAMQDQDEAHDESTPRDELAELRRQNEDLLTKLKYLQAEFENYRKRVDRDAEMVVKFAHELLLSRLLPVLDEMDCIEQVPDPEMKDGAVKSVVRKGYRLHDRVLRPAQVIVVKNRGETNG